MENIYEEFPNVDPCVWNKKKRIYIKNIVIADGGAGQNFLSKLISESLNLDVIVDKLPFNEYNTYIEEGSIFLPIDRIAESWFYYKDYNNINTDSILSVSNTFYNTYKLEQDILKSHATPILFFETFKVKYDNIFLIDHSNPAWFFAFLMVIKQSLQPANYAFRLHTFLNTLQDWSVNTNTNLVDINPAVIYELSENISSNKKYNELAHNTSIFTTSAALYTSTSNMNTDQGIKKAIEYLIRNIEIKIKEKNTSRMKKLNEEFIKNKKNIFYIDYVDFFFKLNFPDHEVFKNIDKQEVADYSWRNLQLAKNILNKVNGYTDWKNQISEWEILLRKNR
jgi:hypothetical protein